MEVAAYYFPNWHVSPLNERWHGKGWTEWELLKAAKPRFPGHRQPIVPAWGYFDESQPTWAAKEIDLAADHGVTAFLFDWYWYEGASYLHETLEQGFLKAPNTGRMKFALMWAIHDWMNIHPALYTNHPELLAKGSVDAAEFEKVTEYIIEKYFRQKNYLRVNGGLYFSIYELSNFIKGLGSLEAAGEALTKFRHRVRKAGLGELHLNAVVWGISVLPTETKVKNAGELVKMLGFDSGTSYVWVHHFDANAAGFPQAPYSAALAANETAWAKYARELPIPYHPNVSMGWDSSPRTTQTSAFENRGYPWMSTFVGNTPEAFEDALRRAKSFAEKLPPEVRMITINAWNEWTEGSYLLPDTVTGTKYLEAIKRVFAPR